MKTALILIFLMLVGSSYAPEPSPEECFKDCCLYYGGEWDEDNGVCDMEYNNSNYGEHSECQEACIEQAFGETPFCCPGAMALLGLVGFAAIKR